jgi:hypothetical protein
LYARFRACRIARRARMEAAMKALGYVRVSRVAGREGDSFLSPELPRETLATMGVSRSCS